MNLVSMLFVIDMQNKRGKSPKLFSYGNKQNCLGNSEFSSSMHPSPSLGWTIKQSMYLWLSRVWGWDVCLDICESSMSYAPQYEVRAKASM